MESEFDIIAYNAVTHLDLTTDPTVYHRAPGSIRTSVSEADSERVDFITTTDNIISSVKCTQNFQGMSCFSSDGTTKYGRCLTLTDSEVTRCKLIALPSQIFTRKSDKKKFVHFVIFPAADMTVKQFKKIWNFPSPLTTGSLLKREIDGIEKEVLKTKKELQSLQVTKNNLSMQKMALTEPSNDDLDTEASNDDLDWELSETERSIGDKILELKQLEERLENTDREYHKVEKDVNRALDLLSKPQTTQNVCAWQICTTQMRANADVYTARQFDDPDLHFVQLALQHLENDYLADPNDRMLSYYLLNSFSCNDSFTKMKDRLSYHSAALIKRALGSLLHWKAITKYSLSEQDEHVIKLLMDRISKEMAKVVNQFMLTGHLKNKSGKELENLTRLEDSCHFLNKCLHEKYGGEAESKLILVKSVDYLVSYRGDVTQIQLPFEFSIPDFDTIVVDLVFEPSIQMEIPSLEETTTLNIQDADLPNLPTSSDEDPKLVFSAEVTEGRLEESRSADNLSKGSSTTTTDEKNKKILKLVIGTIVFLIIKELAENTESENTESKKTGSEKTESEKTESVYRVPTHGDPQTQHLLSKSVQCTGIAVSKKRRCRNLTLSSTMKCHIHRKQDPTN